MKDALEIGKAAEHIVCAHVILQGFRCFLSDQGLPFDVIIEHNGKLLRVQVKATLAARNTSAKGRKECLRYSWNVRANGRRKRSRLLDSECDLVALVALDTFGVAFLPLAECVTTVQLLPTSVVRTGTGHRVRRDRVDDFPLHYALEKMVTPGECVSFSDTTLMEHNGIRLSLAEHARRAGLTPGAVRLRLRRGWTLDQALAQKLLTSWSRRKRNV